MSTLAVTNPTLLDILNVTDPNGAISAVGEILNQTNEILADMTALEGNLATGNQTTVRTGIPLPTWRKMYGGTQPSKSTSVKITDSCGMLENYAEVDKALADLNGNSAAFRLSENRPILEGFNQKVSKYLFYGNEATEPEAITGIAPRFNSLSAQNGQNIIDAGGTGTDNTSIYLVTWSPETAFTFFPKGSKAGIQMNDKGQVTVENVDGNGGRMEAYRTHYRWDIGLTIKNWQYVVRIANVDRSDLTKDAASGADIIDLMTQALELIPTLAMGRPVFYCNRSIRSFLRRQLVNKVKNSTLSMEQVAGKRVLMFEEVPVRRVDQITNAEARVV